MPGGRLLDGLGHAITQTKQAEPRPTPRPAAEPPDTPHPRRPGHPGQANANTLTDLPPPGGRPVVAHFLVTSSATCGRFRSNPIKIWAARASTLCEVVSLATASSQAGTSCATCSALPDLRLTGHPDIVAKTWKGRPVVLPRTVVLVALLREPDLGTLSQDGCGPTRVNGMELIMKNKT